MSFSWQGESGRWYEVDVARAKRAWEPVGGVYMFVKPSPDATMEAGGPVLLFLAQTSNFADALARHDMWAAADQLGAKEIHLYPVADPRQRDAIYNDLLQSQTPILNKQMLRRVA
ncbi:MAG: hypothetical protein GC189_14135 [Alphaproteobacteria bacterium]|nr:hypothetical protein [Alphaproteobacteria bacterium]